MSACPSYHPPRFAPPALAPAPRTVPYFPVTFTTAGAAHEELYELLRPYEADDPWHTRLRVASAPGGFVIAVDAEHKTRVNPLLAEMDRRHGERDQPGTAPPTSQQDGDRVAVPVVNDPQR